MSAAHPQPRESLAHARAVPPPLEVTLLELVQALCDETSDDREVVSVVLHLVRSGRVRPIGSFRGARL